MFPTRGAFYVPLELNLWFLAEIILVEIMLKSYRCFLSLNLNLLSHNLLNCLRDIR